MASKTKGFCELDITALNKAPWNYKLENQFLSTQLATNMARNGQVENIVVREIKDGFEIVNGNHRLDAMEQVGIEKVQVFNLGKISEAQAKRLAIELNETRFESDEQALGSIIRELIDDQGIEEIASTLPYAHQEIASIAEQTDFDWQEIENLTKDKQGSKPKPADNTVKFSLEKDQLALWEKAREATGQTDPVAAFMTIVSTFNRENE